MGAIFLCWHWSWDVAKTIHIPFSYKMYIPCSGFTKMWHTQEVFHDHRKHPQNLCASTIWHDCWLHYNEQVTWGHTFSYRHTPWAISGVLYVRSVQIEQYHLYKTDSHSSCHCVFKYTEMKLIHHWYKEVQVSSLKPVD